VESVSEDVTRDTKGSFNGTALFNSHAPHDDQNDYLKNGLYAELECSFTEFDTVNLLKVSNAQLRKDNIFTLLIRRENLRGHRH
jgi:hypothetical protein